MTSPLVPARTRSNASPWARLRLAALVALRLTLIPALRCAMILMLAALAAAGAALWLAAAVMAACWVLVVRGRGQSR